MRRLLAVLMLAMAGTACTHAQVQGWLELHSSPSLSCQGAVAMIFPPSAQPEMQRIVKRESGDDPRAKNRHSTASGCAQLLAMHAGRFTKCGYSWSTDRFNAYANIRVAYDLWEDNGWSPWKLTA